MDDVGKDHGIDELTYSMAFWTLLWVLLFYVFAQFQNLWMGSVNDSVKEQENERLWCSRMLLGALNSYLVALLAVPACLVLSSAPQHVKFPSKPLDIGECRLELGDDDDLYMWDLAQRATALSAVLFTSFIFADFFISAVHNLGMTCDYVVHHIVFATAGVIIRGHCVIPYNGAILLSMEASTPFLQYALFFRSRGDRYKVGVHISGMLFFVLFMFFRIILNVWGAISLLTMPYDVALPTQVVPWWQGRFCILAICAGAGVQFFWLPRICTKVTDMLKPLLNPQGTARGGRFVRASAAREARWSELELVTVPAAGGNGVPSSLRGGLTDPLTPRGGAVLDQVERSADGTPNKSMIGC